MRILFIGEYSNVYTELSSELKQRGISTFTISDGDAYKNYPCDYRIQNKRNNSSLLNRLTNAVLYRLGLDGLLVFINKWKDL